MAKEGSIASRSGKRSALLITLLIVVALLGAGGFYFWQNHKTHQQLATVLGENTDLNKQLTAYKTDPNQAAQAEADKVIAAVGKLYALPKDEKPSVATVKDKTKLADQPFFAKAENGDTTLIYSTAKLAILYRSSTNQIINVSSVTIQDQPQNPAPAP